MLILLVLLVLITPVRLTLMLDGPFTLDIRLWGAGFQWQPTLSPGQGRADRTQLKRLSGAVLRSHRVRRYLLRHLHLLRLQALIRIGLNDAAHTALLTGLLQQLRPLLPPQADVRLKPDFLSSTRVKARCILFFHLGTIIITAGMALPAWLQERREHPAAKEA